MTENYKHLYEQTKMMLTMYQDEIVPGFRKKIEELEQNQVKVRCKACRQCKSNWCMLLDMDVKDDDFCSYGEKKEHALNEDRCICCGAIIPEGNIVCSNCLVAVDGKNGKR